MECKINFLQLQLQTISYSLCFYFYQYLFCNYSYIYKKQLRPLAVWHDNSYGINHSFLLVCPPFALPLHKSKNLSPPLTEKSHVEHFMQKYTPGNIPNVFRGWEITAGFIGQLFKNTSILSYHKNAIYGLHICIYVLRTTVRVGGFEVPTSRIGFVRMIIRYAIILVQVHKNR